MDPQPIPDGPCGYPGCRSGHLSGTYHRLRPCPVCEQKRVYAAKMREEQMLAPEIPPDGSLPASLADKPVMTHPKTLPRASKGGFCFSIAENGALPHERDTEATHGQ